MTPPERPEVGAHDYRPDPRYEGWANGGPCYFEGCGRDSIDAIHERRRPVAAEPLRGALPIRQLLVKAKAALMHQHDEVEADAYNALAAALEATTPSTPEPALDDFAKTIDALTFGSVFGREIRPTAHELAIFQATAGHIKRLARQTAALDDLPLNEHGRVECICGVARQLAEPSAEHDARTSACSHQRVPSRRAAGGGMKACPGHCAMHHECPCVDKAERHPSGGVADTPGTRRSPRAVPGRQLREALDAIRRSS